MFLFANCVYFILVGNKNKLSGSISVAICAHTSFLILLHEINKSEQRGHF